MMNFLSRLGSMGFYSLLGLGAFAVLIWYFGPIIRIGDTAPLASVTSPWMVCVVDWALSPEAEMSPTIVMAVSKACVS